MWNIESSPLGRIVVPPDGAALLMTTRDYAGALDAELLTQVVRGRFGIESSLTTCRQIHSATVTRAPRPAFGHPLPAMRGEGSESPSPRVRGEGARRADEGLQTWRECDDCDALWSDETNTSLGIKVADCLPVTMIDSTHSVIANVHSGWRGAVQHITSQTIDALERDSRFDAASARAYLSPSIRVCCFEVGEEVASQFDERFVVRSDGRASYAKPHVDLPAMTADVLRARGITNVSDSGMCTRCDGSIFHSYRRDGKGGGRNLVIVAQ